MDDRTKLPHVPPNEAAGIPVEIPTDRPRRDDEEERKRREGKDADEERKKQAPTHPWKSENAAGWKVRA